MFQEERTNDSAPKAPNVSRSTDIFHFNYLRRLEKKIVIALK